MINATEKKLAIFPASFDPITIGHLDIILRAAQIFDHVLVLVANNYSKKYLFSLQQRLDLTVKSINQLKVDHQINNITCTSSDQLLIDEYKQYNACCIVRGVRNYQDFEYEVNLAHINQELYKLNFNLSLDSDSLSNSNVVNTDHKQTQQLETIYLVAKPNLKHISSSLIRELSSSFYNFNSYAKHFLPSVIYDDVRELLFPTVLT